MDWLKWQMESSKIKKYCKKSNFLVSKNSPASKMLKTRIVKNLFTSIQMMKKAEKAEALKFLPQS
jgi:hypothetical protein